VESSLQTTADERLWQARRLAGFLYLSAAIMVVAGIALGFVVTPALFALVAVGLTDGVLAALFASGRIGPLASRDASDPAEHAEQDPTYNPYARED
jgi:hypothetical protein